MQHVHNAIGLSVLPIAIRRLTHALWSKKAISQRVMKVPTDPVKLAQYRKIELMKMRHRASPGDPKDSSTSAPLEERLHVKVVVANGAEKLFWFRKRTIAGKVLDLLANHFKMKTSNESSLQLAKAVANDDVEVLHNDRPIAEQVEDGDQLVVVPVGPRA
ncbi:putative AN1-like Zinc finger [Lyophyllum shimeji]|uniref:AN1-like Zinc finger n=1 Tax=Lyophyllum shimeji TaxID=47721 RepID=A0A9P3PFV9_LYOSH|nr:putative AN1-like Zinc finger [Lyophyllum shimeji]